MPYYISQSNPDCSGWAVEKIDGEVIGCHTTKQDAIDHMVAVSIAEKMEPGGERVDPVAPKKDQITGSDKNPAGSASGKAGGIDLNEATVSALETKAEEHNKSMAERDRPNWTRVRVGALKSVYRRGSGAFSGSHRPGIGRAQWSMARVNAFLFLARTGRPENPKYIGDNDLLHKDHPRYSEAKSLDLRVLPDNYRPALAPDVPEGRACGNCHYYDESRQNADGTKAWCEQWDDFVDGGYYCNAWEPHEEDDMVRAVNLNLPQYIKAAARKGLDYYGQGLAGDGLVDATVRAAREMAAGRISEDKVIKANAWGQRHLVDLQPSKNSDANDKEFPGAGAVAFYLWGINPLNPQPAMDWFMNKADAIKADRSFFFHRTGTQDSGTLVSMTDKVETRRITSNDFELRAAQSGDGMSFSGYAAVFESDSEPLPFIERIKHGAFAKSLKSKNKINMYMNHDSTMLLASTRSGTLRLSEDSKGLMVNADLPQTSVGKDLSILMQRGDVNSMSFGFTVPQGGDRWSDDGKSRELRQIRLHEVSVVTGFPAYTATTASVRSFDALAVRTGMDADRLAEAITVLETGNTLSVEQGVLLRETVAKLSPEVVVDSNRIGILAKHLDMIKTVI